MGWIGRAARAHRLGWRSLHRPSIVGSLMYLAASVGVLAERNIYDDELGGFALIGLRVDDILKQCNATDVHPPGMYILAKAAYALIPDARWMAVFPIILCAAGLLLFIERLDSRSLLGTGRLRYATALLMGVSPQLLLWTNSSRWYSWWSSIALPLGVYFATEKHPTLRRSLAYGTLFGILFYISYLTIVLLGALLLIELSAQIPALTRPSRAVDRARLLRLGLIISTFAILAAPQVGVLLRVHLRGGGEQMGNPLLAGALLGYGLLVSEAFFPWSPWGLLGCLCLIVGVGVGAVTCLRIGREDERKVLALVGLLVLAGAVTGLGIKPRSFVFLVPLIVWLAMRGWAVLTRRLGSAVYWGGFAVLVAHACIGYGHLVSRQGLAKAALTDRPEQATETVLDVDARLRAQEEVGQTLVLVRDPGVAYDLMRTIRLRGIGSERILVLPARPLGLPDSLRPQEPGWPMPPSSPIALVMVESYDGSDPARMGMINGAEAGLRSLMEAQVNAECSKDPVAAWKRSFSKLLPQAASLPDYRFRINGGIVKGAALKRLEPAIGVWRALF